MTLNDFVSWCPRQKVWMRRWMRAVPARCPHGWFWNIVREPTSVRPDRDLLGSGLHYNDCVSIEHGMLCRKRPYPVRDICMAKLTGELPGT